MEGKHTICYFPGLGIRRCVILGDLCVYWDSRSFGELGWVYRKKGWKLTILN